MNLKKSDEILIFKTRLLIFLFLSFITSAQTPQTTKKINQFLAQSITYFEDYDHFESFESAKKAYELAKKNDNKKLIAASYHRMACVAAELSMYKEALELIVKGRESCPPNDIMTKACLDEVEAYVFTSLGLYKEAIKNYHSVEEVFRAKKNDVEAQLFLFDTYENLGAVYYRLENVDSLNKYTNIAERLILSLPEKEVEGTLSIFYYNKGQSFLEHNKRDSAFVMFEKCQALEKKYNRERLYYGYSAWGDYYFESDPKKSLYNYLKAIENMETKNIIDFEFFKIYKQSSILYGKLGDDEKEKYYFGLYMAKEEEEKIRKSKNLDSAMDIIISKSQEDYGFSESKLFWILGVGAVILLVVFFLLKKAKDNNAQFESDLQIQDIVVKELQQKVNESLSEIMQLAKENDPQFWLRFQDVYPDFSAKMRLVNPNLKVSELIYCAYLYLNFTTKEIADYTFKAVKTIENRRYNLRKRLGLNSEEDLLIWIREYIDKR